MTKYTIVVDEIDVEEKRIVETDGYLLVHFQGDKVKVEGGFDLKMFMPIIAKYVMERMAK